MGGRKKVREDVNVSDLEYAGDMAQMSDSMDALEVILKTLNRLYV